MLLEGRTAIVTGATRGIGRAIATAFAKEGARLVVSGRDAALDEVASELTAGGAEIHVLRGDLTDERTSKALVAEARKRFGHVDVLVNNAGILRQALLGMTSDATARELMEVNVVALIALTQYAVRAMKTERHPSVINLASIAGTRGMEGVAAYAASKGAVAGFTLAAAKELAPRGIRVNAIAPGFIDTDMTRGLAPDWYQRRVASIGLGRIGTPADVAGAAVFLASDLSSYMTGQILGVDGGMQA